MNRADSEKSVTPHPHPRLHCCPHAHSNLDNNGYGSHVTQHSRKRKSQKQHKKILLSSAWNVRTVLDLSSCSRPEPRTAVGVMELSRYGIDIAALCATRFSDQGKPHETGVGYRFYWIGRSVNEPREQCVGLAISDRIQHMVTSLGRLNNTDPPPRSFRSYSPEFTPDMRYMAGPTAGAVQASCGILSHRRLLASARVTGKSVIGCRQQTSIQIKCS